MSELVPNNKSQADITAREIQAAEGVAKEWVGKIAKQKFGQNFLKIAGSDLPSDQKALKFVDDTRAFAVTLTDTLRSPTYAIPEEAIERVVSRVMVQGIKDAVDAHGGLKDVPMDVSPLTLGNEGSGADIIKLSTGSSTGREVADSKTALLTALFDRFSSASGAGFSKQR